MEDESDEQESQRAAEVLTSDRWLAHCIEVKFTQAAMRSVRPSVFFPALGRHMQGQWGLADDTAFNRYALLGGGRVLSKHALPEGGVFYIVTRFDMQDMSGPYTSVMMADEFHQAVLLDAV